MTIHRGLSELKLIDSKIEKQTKDLVPCGINQKDKLIYGYITEEDLKKSAQSNYDSILALIDRKIAIKSAIVNANGVTKVKVGEKEMTIADAINYKSVLWFKKALVNQLLSKHKGCVAELNKNNEIVESNVQKLLEFTFGKENVKVDVKDIDAVRKPYIESNQFHLFDPLKIEDKISSLHKEIEEFEMEVDSVLSEINSITFIEV